MHDELIGWDEIAAFLHVSRVTAWRYNTVGNMPVIRMCSGKVRASRQEIRRWIIETDVKIRGLKQLETQ